MMIFWTVFGGFLRSAGDCSEHVCDDVHCHNGGSCVVTSPDSSACLCPLGISGPRCQSSKFVYLLLKEAKCEQRSTGLRCEMLLI